ncbi:hypothetical protein MMPV_010167 [Pyropia vietnamensis]
MAASAAAGNTGGGGDTDEPSPPSPGTPPPSRPRLRRYISSAQGRSLVTEAITTTFGGSAKAYATAAAGSVVDAITATYTIGGGEAEGEGGGGPPSVLVAFGVGLTGAVGVETAVGLAAVGYSATLLRVGEEDGLPPWRVDAEAAAEAAGIDIIEFVPAGTAFYFDLLVDAVIGNDPLDWGDGVDPDDAPVVAATALTPPLLATTADAASGGLIPDGATTVLAALASSSVPVVCVDHPLGWATDRGPPDLAVRRDSFVKPDLLVSTAVPLRSARFFGGRYHYVGGGVVPPGWGAAAGVAVRGAPTGGRGARGVIFGENAGGPRRRQRRWRRQQRRPGACSPWWPVGGGCRLRGMCTGGWGGGGCPGLDGHLVCQGWAP